MATSPAAVSPPTPTRWQLVARAIRSHQPSSSGWPSAIRRGLLVGVIVAVGAAVGEFATAATIAVGALNVGLVDPVVPRRLLAVTLAAVSIATSVIAFVAAGVAGTWWAVPVLMVLAYVSGAIGSSGLVAFNMTFMALVTAVLFTNDPGTWAEAAHLGALVFVGSLLQGASTLIAWRPEREASIRRSYANFVDAMREFAVTTDSLTVGHLRAASAQMAAEGVIDSAGLNPAREQRFRDLLDQLSWTRLCLSNWIATGKPTQEQRSEVARTLENVGLLLQHGRARRSATTGQIARPLGDVSPTHTDPAWVTLVSQIEQLQRAAFEFTAHSRNIREGTGAKAASRRRVDRAAAAAVRTSIPKLLRPGAAGSRHALRLALAVGAAEAIALGFSVERGYWIVLTVVMVVKPDFSTTLIRGLLRVAGTTAAVILAGAVLSLTSSPQWLMVTLIFLFAPLTMRWITANYAFASFAIGVTVLLLIEAGEPSGSPIWLRLLNTAIGAVLGLLAYLLLPRWSGDNVRARLASVLETQQRWTTLVLNSLSDGSYDAGEARKAGEVARDRMLEARPAVEAAIIEPHRAECDPAAALAMLDACEQVAMATLALEVEVLDPHESTVHLPPDTTATLVDQLAEDFETAARLISTPMVGARVGSRSASFAQQRHEEATLATGAGATARLDDPQAAHAIDLLSTAADATVSAARNLVPKQTQAR